MIKFLLVDHAGKSEVIRDRCQENDGGKHSPGSSQPAPKAPASQEAAGMFSAVQGPGAKKMELIRTFIDLR